MPKISSKKGRATKYTQAIAEEICNAIASNSKGIKELCKENPHWPNKDTIFTWLKNHSEFSDQYVRAKKCQVETLVDEILDIADDTSQDQLIDAEGKIIFNHQALNRARLKIDTRKWLASKLIPKVYGTKAEDEEPNEKLHQDVMERYKQLEEQYRKEY
ncbi:hypothetical protein [Legionella sp.]|uniref:terminase small subunit-like protein n=1 Tax=Legionella sp. TaxID=459 RepID=UPI0032207CAF